MRKEEEESIFNSFMEKIKAWIVPSLFGFIIFLLMTFGAYIKKDFEDMKNSIEDIKSSINDLNTKNAVQEQRIKNLELQHK